MNTDEKQIAEKIADAIREIRDNYISWALDNNLKLQQSYLNGLDDAETVARSGGVIPTYMNIDAHLPECIVEVNSLARMTGSTIDDVMSLIGLSEANYRRWQVNHPKTPHLYSLRRLLELAYFTKIAYASFGESAVRSWWDDHRKHPHRLDELHSTGLLLVRVSLGLHIDGIPTTWTEGVSA